LVEKRVLPMVDWRALYWVALTALPMALPMAVQKAPQTAG
jgi:hypothetical protein